MKVKKTQICPEKSTLSLTQKDLDLFRIGIDGYLNSYQNLKKEYEQKLEEVNALRTKLNLMVYNIHSFNNQFKH